MRRGSVETNALLDQSLPFQKVQHRVDTLDSQPSDEAGGVLVLVTGALLVRAGELYRT